MYVLSKTVFCQLPQVSDTSQSYMIYLFIIDHSHFVLTSKVDFGVFVVLQYYNSDSCSQSKIISKTKIKLRINKDES